MFSAKEILDFVIGRTEAEVAKFVAYLVAPGFVFGLAVTGVYLPGVGLDFGKPLLVSDLETEISANGEVVSKRGLAIIIEPADLEYQIPFDSATKMWSSLDKETFLANAHQLVLTPNGLRGKSPLIGVNRTTTVVVQGKVGSEILLPGRRESLAEWRVQSKRSFSLVSSALLACVFAFGLSLALGLPTHESNQQTTRKHGADPHKE